MTLTSSSDNGPIACTRSDNEFASLMFLFLKSLYYPYLSSVRYKKHFTSVIMSGVKTSTKRTSNCYRAINKLCMHNNIWYWYCNCLLDI